ncbi:MAG: VanZ family protein [Phycisphaerae bacterium]
MRGESDRFSDEPLIRLVHRHLAAIILVVCAAFIVYTSLVPFDFIGTAASVRPARAFLRLGFAPHNLPDIVANMGYYLPLGMLGYLALRRLACRGVVSAAGTIVAAGLLSLLIEEVQYYIASRVSSWVDVTANVLGATLGVMLVAVWHPELRRLLQRGRTSVRQNERLAAAKVLACLLLALHLRPYDAVVDPLHTASALRHADVGALAGWNHLPDRVAREVRAGRRTDMSELSRVRWEYALDRFVDIAGYAGLSVLLVLGYRRRFRARWFRYAWAGFVVISLAMIVTVIRIFLISHGLDMAHLYCGIVGWLLGSAGASAIGLDRTARAAAASQHGLPRGLVNAAMAIGLVVPVLYELVPFDVGAVKEGTASARLSSIGYVPFAAQFLSRPNDAFYDISGTFLRYGAIGVCLALWMSVGTVWRWRRQLLANVVMTGGGCLILESLHLTMPSRHVDVTTCVLAVVAAFSASVGVRWVRDYRAALLVTFRDDPLTRQLIEGETYPRTPAVPPRSAAGLTSSRGSRGDASRKDQAESRSPSGGEP